MLNNVDIQNFKGLSSCSVKDLKRINLFVGKNDSGKSTIFEALYYAIRGLHEIVVLNDSLTRRTNVFSSGRELWYRYNTDAEILVQFAFEEASLGLKIVYDKSREATQTSYEYFQTGIEKSNQLFMRDSRGFQVVIGQSTDYVANLIPIPKDSNKNVREYASSICFIDSTLREKVDEVEKQLAKIKINDLDEDFGNLLNEIYEKGEEWEFIPHIDNTDEKRVAFKEGGKLTYFGDFGDGMRLGVGTLGTLMNLKNTGVFIEEIENHQHFGSLQKLIKALVEISEKNNLQIFISTHSDYVWNTLQRVVYKDVEKRDRDFRCFVIERDSKTGKTKVEKTSNLDRIIDALK